MHRGLAWTLALAVGGLAGGVSHTLGTGDPLLTSAVVASYAIAARLSVRHPDTLYESDVALWTVGRWSGASIAILLAVALVGVGPTLPLGADLRLSLRLLVIGVGYAMWLLGISYARAKSDANAA